MYPGGKEGRKLGASGGKDQSEKRAILRGILMRKTSLRAANSKSLTCNASGRKEFLDYVGYPLLAR